MKRIAGFLNNMGIRNHLLLVSTCLIFISVSMCCIVLSIYWYVDSIRRFDMYSDEITKQVSTSVDAYFQGIDRLAISIAYSDSIQSILSVDYKKVFGSYGPNAAMATWYLQNMKYAASGIQSIYVYTEDGHFFSSPISFRNLDYNFNNEPWLQDFIMSDEQTRVIGPYVNNQETFPVDEVITVIRKVRSLENMEQIGYVLINIKLEDMLSNNLQKVWETDNGELVIVNGSNQIVFDSSGGTTEGSPLDADLFSRLYSPENHFDFTYGGEKSRIVFSSSEKGGWFVLRITTYRYLYSGVRNMIFISAVAIVIIVLLVLFPILAFSNKFVRPILNLQRSMRKFETGNFDQFDNIHTHIASDEDIGNEMTLLAESFNIMTIRLHYMIQKIYQTEAEKRKLEIAALSTQINPHFIRNTLSTIKQMALLQKSKGIADLADAIINLLRSTEKYGDGTTTVKKELELINDYILILQMRYYGNFSVNFSCEEEAYNKCTLCMLLQPIVENAIFHGIQGIGRMGVIEISVAVNDGRLEFTVSDNGVGIPPDKVTALLVGRQKPLKESEHVGIYNVNKRIQLNYGEEYGLFISPNHPYGTVVKISLPLIEGREDV